MSGGALIAGKITVELNADATRKHFGGVVGVVGFAGLSHPNYKPTMGGRCTKDGVKSLETGATGAIGGLQGYRPL